MALSSVIYVKYDNTTEHMLLFFKLLVLWVCSCCTVSTNEHQMCCECAVTILLLKKKTIIQIQCQRLEHNNIKLDMKLSGHSL